MLRANSPEVDATGVPGLDDVLAGGLPRNHIYLIQGSPGVGKTTLALQFLLAGVASGEKVLYVTLSETAEELRAVAESHHWSLDGVPIHEIIPTGDFTNSDDNTLFHPSEVELGETTRVILREVERLNPSRVVIDSLTEIRLLSQNPLRYRRQVLALKQFFAGKRCTALLLEDGAGSPGDVHLESIAHGIVKLELLSPVYGSDRRRIQVRKLRGVSFRGGFHDMKIETGGVVVFPRLAAVEPASSMALGNVSGGVSGIDRLLGGGLERGTTTLIMGPAGAGKSAIAAQYAAEASSRGEHVVMFSFEEGLTTLLQRTAALGIPLAREIEAGRVRVRQVDPAEISPGEFSQLVRKAVEEDSARLIVIDSLNGYYTAMPEEEFLSLQLNQLFRFLRQRGVVVLVTMAQHGFIGPMEGPLDVSFLADTVVLLRYFEERGEIRKAISVPKKRSGKHELAIREMVLDDRGIHIGEPLSNFTGVLSGSPQYVVHGGGLMSEDEHERA